MAKKRKNTARKKKIRVDLSNRRMHFVLSIFLMLAGLFVLFAFLSFYTSAQADQSILERFGDKTVHARNMMGKAGAAISRFFIFDGFGVGSLLLPVALFTTGLFLFFRKSLTTLVKYWIYALSGMLWLSVFMGFVYPLTPSLSGVTGFRLSEYLQIYLGAIGLGVLLLFLLVLLIASVFELTPEHLSDWFKKWMHKKEQPEKRVKIEDHEEEIPIDVYSPKEEIIADSSTGVEPDFIPTTDEVEVEEENEVPQEVQMDVEVATADTEEGKNLSDRLVEDFGEFDPTLELSSFKFPPLDLLKKYDDNISVSSEELQENKDRIVKTLSDYSVRISHIKATVGPTVTLYEIVPASGVRISKIKNLESDIALSLSAIGIRIIAPIPGKGTIGIEVPNQKPSIVSMRSVIASTKFQQTDKELPIAFGRTISNETFVADLAKMPHLLMAGATGQGKSVGINAILTSLLYKKHPAELKFVLVDPKKVELSLYNKIERHYLAKLPGSEEAIITDTTKVVHTLNSLCIEMDDRYDLLKTAMVRNIKEYNRKFKERKLNPENGHRYLPYIVVVIDEFSDLIMTAGKEIETPIARLAQLARAIGIHLIVATQRPSVNVITGIIKANFPSRVAFRVSSKIDSRTILDSQGADQLIGKGDMLFSGGNQLVRLQCAFVDTPEIERITDYIGSQKAYPTAYELPEYEDESMSIGGDMNPEDRDPLFKEAAYVIVRAQQGSASLLQRKLKLGYNRAGRIIDQLEAAGIVGPFEGSKARQVLIADELSLKQFFENE